MKVILLIIIAICTKAIYDARKIAEKFFSNGNVNNQARLIKMIGFLVIIICSIIFINI